MRFKWAVGGGDGSLFGEEPLIFFYLLLLDFSL
jgi:hypothetical protein